MKIQIEIEDNLNEKIDNIKEEIKQDFINYLKENPDIEDFDNYYQKSGCDFVHETVDSNTPIYNKNINDLYYLYRDEFDEAYKNAGIGDGTEDNHRQVAIYCYLSEKGFDYLRELEDLFNEYVNQYEDTRQSITKLVKELEDK